MDETVLIAAQAGLTRRYQRPIRLEAIQGLVEYQGATSHIYRCAVDGPLPGRPQTVVVKYAVNGSGLMAREWVAYDLLKDSPGVREKLPHHFYIHPELEFSVMEDFGEGGAGLLGEILFQNDRERAEAACLDYVRLLAAVHIETRGRQTAWVDQIAARGAGGRTRHKVFRLGETLESFRQVSSRIGIPFPDRAEAEVREIRAILAQPGPFLALSHGDTTPANYYTRNGRSWLYDWETSGYRHCLLDGTISQIRDLHSVWARDIPASFRARMFDAYREAIATGIPEAAQDRLFFAHFSACCLAWLGGLLDFFARIEVKDHRWGRSTLRQRIFTGLRQIGEMDFGRRFYPALYSLAGELQTNIRKLWPAQDRRLPLFPVFTDPE
jgi:hypothetical protein